MCYLLCLCVGCVHVSVDASKGQRYFDSFGIGVMDVVSRHPTGLLEIKLRPLRVQLVSMCSLNW